MNNKEYSLVSLLEEANELSKECNELIKACTKALRFGLDSENPVTCVSNNKDIMVELIDVGIRVKNLIHSNYLVPLSEEEYKRIKQIKEEKFIRYKDHYFDNL